jgi:outer membrane protein, heavy metal efflux system
MSFISSTLLERAPRACVRLVPPLIACALALTPHRAPAQEAAAPNGAASRDTLPMPSNGRQIDSGRQLDSLVALALTGNPTIRAASASADAARHRVVVAGTAPDPVLMAGIQNLPLGRESATSPMSPAARGGPDPMTMRMVGVSQAIPYPGKLALRRRIAEQEARSADVAIERARREVVRDVKVAYYELAFLEQGLAIVARNRDMLASIVRLTDARYGLGTASQPEVLQARLEASRLAETASNLAEQRRAALARLDAAIGRPSETPVNAPAIPARITRAAVADAPSDVRFVSNALGARAAGSPLPPLAELQTAAVANDASIREHEAMIVAQAARVELAGKDRLPDLDVAIQYGQRGGGLPDMVSASVSVPLPIVHRRRQDEGVAEATARLHALHAEHDAAVNDLQSKVAQLVSEIERERTQLALYVKATLPQSRATLTATAASFQVGRAGLVAVLDVQSALFTTETDYFRALTDFARNLAELERLTGREIGS